MAERMTKSKMQANTKLQAALRLISQARSTRESRKKLPLFIRNDDDDPDEQPVVQSCADYTIHGRCLGYHHQGTSMNKTALQSTSQTNFDETLNGSLMALGPLEWSKNLHTLPKWAVQKWLKACPQKCEKNATMVPCKNAVGNELEDLINESIREQLSVSPRHMSLPVQIGQRQLPPVPLFPPSTSTVSGHTTRVRIQQSPQSSNNNSNNVINSPVQLHSHPNVQDNKLESWHVMRIQGTSQVCVRGKEMRSRKIWRSAAIHRRISPRSLVTSSGTVYHLVGKPHNKDNVMPGYIEESFNIGFPNNWSALIKKWTNEEDETGAFLATHCLQYPTIDESLNNNAQSSRKRSRCHVAKVRNYSKSGSESDDDEDEDPKTVGNSMAEQKRAPTKYKAVIKEYPASSSETSDADEKKATKGKGLKTKPKTKKTNHSKTKLTRNTQFESSDSDCESSATEQNCSVVLRKLNASEIQSMQATSTTKEGEKWLSKWRPVFDKERKTIQLAGVSKMKNGTIEEKNHLSPTIIKRLDTSCVESNGGLTYHLIGPSYWPKGEPNVPQVIEKKFENGFPYNWIAVVQMWSDTIQQVVPSPTRAATHVQPKKQKHLRKKKEIDDGNETDTSSISSDTASELVAIRVATSSRGRKIIQPLKYWESEKLVVSANRLYLRSENEEKLLNGSKSPGQLEKKKSTRKAAAGKRVHIEDKPKQVKVKKPRVTNKTQQPKNASNKDHQKKTAEKVAEEESATESDSKKKGGKKITEKTTENADPIGPDEMLEVLSKTPKTLKEREIRGRVLKNLHDENAHVIEDYFAVNGSVMSSSDASDDTLWDALSVSSKVSSEEDIRLKFNYSPPAQRMSNLVGGSPSKVVDPSMVFHGKKADRRSKTFVHRQLTMKRARRGIKLINQERRASANATLMKYKKDNATDHRLANEMFQRLTTGEVDFTTSNYLQPVHDKDTDDPDDRPEEPYFPEEEAESSGDFFVHK